MSDWYYRNFYTPAAPRKVKGGIKAQAKRGGFGNSWWAKRWIGVLESFQIGARLGRGRSYARKGQVVSISVDPGSVTAEVQGTRAAPYQIEIRVKTLSAAGWGRITDALSAQPIFAAKLLTGEMPEDIEAVFQEQKLSLFPEKLKDLTTKCSCPDWSNPCKHIAAVYYLLGEEFDRDPFLIFKLRGMERDELLKRLGRFAGGATAKTGKKTAGAVEKHEDTPAAIPEPLPDDPELFWLPKNRDQWEAKEVSIPTLAAPLVKRLGAFPFWRGETPFLESLEAIYVGASPGGLDVYLGERKTGSK